MEEHSAAQVKSLQQEQKVLEDHDAYIPGSESAEGSNFDAKELLKVQTEVVTLQKEMFRLQKEHDEFVKETYEMFSEVKLLTCEAIENCFGNRRA